MWVCVELFVDWNQITSITITCWPSPIPINSNNNYDDKLLLLITIIMTMIKIIMITVLIIEIRLRQSQWSHVDLPNHGTNVRLNSYRNSWSSLLLQIPFNHHDMYLFTKMFIHCKITKMEMSTSCWKIWSLLWRGFGCQEALWRMCKNCRRGRGARYCW